MSVKRFLILFVRADPVFFCLEPAKAADAAAAPAAKAADLIVGVNVVNPMRASVAGQDAIIAQLKAADVHHADRNTAP